MTLAKKNLNALNGKTERGKVHRPEVSQEGKGASVKKKYQKGREKRKGEERKQSRDEQELKVPATLTNATQKNCKLLGAFKGGVNPQVNPLGGTFQPVGTEGKTRGEEVRWRRAGFKGFESEKRGAKKKNVMVGNKRVSHKGVR